MYDSQIFSEAVQDVFNQFMHPHSPANRYYWPRYVPVSLVPLQRIPPLVADKLLEDGIKNESK